MGCQSFRWSMVSLRLAKRDSKSIGLKFSSWDLCKQTSLATINGFCWKSPRADHVLDYSAESDKIVNTCTKANGGRKAACRGQSRSSKARGAAKVSF